MVSEVAAFVSEVAAFVSDVAALVSDVAAAVADAAAAVAELAALVALVVAAAASTNKDHFALSTFVVKGSVPDDVCAVKQMKILFVEVSFTISLTA